MKLCNLALKSRCGRSFFLLVAGCSHKRSWQYYVESLEARNNQDKDFKSYLCPDYAEYDSGSCASAHNVASCSDTLTCGHMGERLKVAKFDTVQK